MWLRETKLAHFLVLSMCIWIVIVIVSSLKVFLFSQFSVVLESIDSNELVNLMHMHELKLNKLRELQYWQCAVHNNNSTNLHNRFWTVKKKTIWCVFETNSLSFSTLTVIHAHKHARAHASEFHINYFVVFLHFPLLISSGQCVFHIASHFNRNIK